MLVKSMEVLSCFSETREEYFFKLVGSVVSKMQRINIKRGTRSLLFSVQNVKITFILFKYPRSIDNPIGFTFLSCREKIHDNIEFSCENSKPCRESRIMTR